MIGTFEEATHAAMVAHFIAQLMVTLRCEVRRSSILWELSPSFRTRCVLDAGVWMEGMTETEVTKPIFKQLL